MATVHGLFVANGTVQEIKEFLEEHQQEIIDNEWQEIFNDFTYINSTGGVFRLANFLTAFLLAADIDFLPYLTELVPNCFYNLNITEITIPANIYRIKGCAFQDCEKLEKITFVPGNLLAIDKAVFLNCIALEEIEFPDGLSKIDDEAFYYCKKLKKVVIPKSLQYLGNTAFQFCRGEKNKDDPLIIEYRGTLADWKKSIGDDWYNRSTAILEVKCTDCVFTIQPYSTRLK